MSIVQITIFPIKADAALPERPADVKEKLGAVPGLIHAYHGNDLDASGPKLIEMIDIWESKEAALKARESPEAKEAVKQLDPILDQASPMKPRADLFAFDKDFVPVAEAACVQLTAILVPAATSQADVEAKWAESMKALGGEPEGLVAGTHGWSDEEIDHPAEGKVRIFLLAAGWESIEKAKAAGESAKEHFASIQGLGSVHARFTKLVKVK